MDTRTPTAHALSTLIETIFRVNGLILKIGEDLTRPTGQTSARWQVLGSLSQGPASVPQVARRMGLTRQSVQRVADILAFEGLIVFQENPDHKRSKLLELTSKGQIVSSAIQKAALHWRNGMGKILGKSDLRKANKLLVKIEETIRKKTSKPVQDRKK